MDIQECRQKCSVISPEELKEARNRRIAESPYSQWKIIEIERIYPIYYDANIKVFFSLFADGNYYHGYDVSYHVMSKEWVLERLARNIKKSSAYSADSSELIMFAVVDSLETNTDIKKYDPPIAVGEGIHYM